MWVVIALLIMILDRVSKLYIATTMHTGQSRTLYGELLDLTYVQNQGVAFGQFSGIEAITTYLPIVLVLACIVGMIAYRKRTGLLMRIAAGLVIGGGIGNITDRLLLGYVIDFIDIKLWPPVFNVADIAICIGCGLFLIAILISSGRDDEDEEEEPPEDTEDDRDAE